MKNICFYNAALSAVLLYPCCKLTNYAILNKWLYYHIVIDKNKAWSILSDAAKAEYQALRNEFVRQSAAMLKEFDKSGETELEKKIREYLGDMDSKRLELERKAK